MPGNRTGPPQGPRTEQSTVDNGNTQTSATQALVDEGAARRDAGMQLSIDALQPAWRSVAEDVLDDLIESGLPFSSDDLRDRVNEPAGTGSARALGAMFNARSRRGEIVQVGWTTSRQPQRHNAPSRIWQGTAS